MTEQEAVELLAQADSKIADLEQELESVRDEVTRLMQETMRLESEKAHSERDLKRDAEWKVMQERERIRRSVEEVHQRELRVRDTLQGALERLLAERESEIGSMKMELEAAAGMKEAPVVSREEPEVTARSEVERSGGEKPSEGLITDSKMKVVSRGVDAGAVVESETGGAGVSGGRGGGDTGVAAGSSREAGGSGGDVVSASGGAKSGRPGKAAEGVKAGHTVHGGAGTRSETASSSDGVAAITTSPSTSSLSSEDSQGGLKRSEVQTGGMKLPALPNFSAETQSGLEGEAYERWLRKLAKHAELQRWTGRNKLLQFELHLTGRAERIYEVLSEDVKTDFSKATAALGERLRPAGRKALASAQLLSRKQKTGERVDAFVQVFEDLFEKLRPAGWY